MSMRKLPYKMKIKVIVCTGVVVGVILLVYALYALYKSWLSFSLLPDEQAGDLEDGKKNEVSSRNTNDVVKSDIPAKKSNISDCSKPGPKEGLLHRLVNYIKETLSGATTGGSCPEPGPTETDTETISISASDLKRATRNFTNKVGEGGFGPVYFGRLPGNRMEVAVKVQAKNSQQGAHEFATEVEILSRAKHPNLVSLIGYSQGKGGYMLVYEFLHGGTLQDRLYGDRCRPPLEWRTRLKIAAHAAKGLEYLHNDCDPSIIHRDVKSNNILLTTSGDAKVTDFGLCKFLDGDCHDHISTCSIKGTSGYLDPEYHDSTNLTHKSDVYSFGIVLLELITGREPIDKSLPEEERKLSVWARRLLMANTIEPLVDKAMNGRFSRASVWIVAELAMACVEPLSMHRPTITQAVQELEMAIQQEAVDHADQSFGTPSLIQIQSPSMQWRSPA